MKKKFIHQLVTPDMVKEEDVLRAVFAYNATAIDTIGPDEYKEILNELEIKYVRT